MQKRKVGLQEIAWAITLLVVAGVVVSAVVRFGFSVELLIFLPFVLGGSAFFVFMARRAVWDREAEWRSEIAELAEELQRERTRGEELAAELDRLRDQPQG